MPASLRHCHAALFSRTSLLVALCVGLAGPSFALVPALKKFPVEDGTEVTVGSHQLLNDGTIRWEGRAPGVPGEYRLDVWCSKSRVTLSYTDGTGDFQLKYALVRPGQEWAEVEIGGLAFSVPVGPELQRLATAQHSAVCLPRMYPNAPQAPQV